MTQLARPDEHMRQELQRSPGVGVPLERFDRAQ
jgi:hypothetical protein